MQETLAQRVYRRLRDRLVKGSFPPGTRLVNRKIARQVGASAIPVREAISRLASEGLVDYIPGAGAFVPRPDRRELAQLYDLREALEPLAAAEACRHLLPQDLADLKTACVGLHSVVRELRRKGARHATPAMMKRWLDYDERFHETLVRAGRNPWLSRIVGELRILAQVFGAQRAEPELLTLRVAARTWRSHMALLGAVRRRSEREARSWMTVQLREGRRHVLDYFNRKQLAEAVAEGGR